jgi:P-type Mg2+ transporter
MASEVVLSRCADVPGAARRTLEAILPYTGLARLPGFTPLPAAFFLRLAGMVVVYLLLVELAKTRYYRAAPPRAQRPALTPRQRLERRVR